MEFGNNVKAFRRAAHLTQKQLAEAAGCSVSFISHIEAERKGCSDGIKVAICRLLGQPLQKVFYQEKAS